MCKLKKMARTGGFSRLGQGLSVDCFLTKYMVLFTIGFPPK
jgi:hypothetical protein